MSTFLLHHNQSKRPVFSLLLGLLSLLMLSSSLHAQEPNRLLDYNFASLPSNEVEISLFFAQPAELPQAFTIEKPARIVLDFKNTELEAKKRREIIQVGVADSINLAQAKNRTRAVLNLSRQSSYEMRTDGNRLVITLQTEEEQKGNNVIRTSEGDIIPNVRQDSPQRSINGIDFRRGSSGEGRIFIKLSDPNTPIDLKDQLGRITIEALRTSLPQHLERRLDVLDFATPVKAVDAYEDDDIARIVISTTGEEYEQLAYQSDNVFIVEIKPLSEEEEIDQQLDSIMYTGERLSLNFQDIEVRSVLQLIADFTGLNVVVSDTVSGNITLRLKNVPWDQALDIILKTKGLTSRQNENVLLIAPTEEITAQEKLELESNRQVEELAPLQSELLQINYARAEDIASLLRQEGSSLVSDRGSVTVDARTNLLLVQETPNRLPQIRRLVKRLDVPVRQVLIESRIVTADDDFTKELGVRFGVSQDSLQDATEGDGTFVSGSLEGTTQLINNEDLIADDRLSVNLPTSTSAGSLGIALAKLPFGTLLELELSAAQVESRAEVLSSPRVITSNQSQARIEQGVEIPYQEASASGATSVSFKKAVLSLQVTPSITPDDRIFMELEVSKDSVGQIISGIPSVDTRKVNTQVLVDNGQTVVLGGIYEQTNNSTKTKVPFFADIPIIGRLFENSIETSEKSELLIFVTPKIVNEDLSKIN